MKQHFHGVPFIVCIFLLLSLVGCKQKDPVIPNGTKEDNSFMLDSSGMEYVPPWTEFTLSRSDSNAQYIFWFTVKDTDSEVLVTGECRNKDGGFYEEENGIPISAETIWALRWMDLERLSNVDESEILPDGMDELLDGSDIRLYITLDDGTVVKKNASDELSMEIYKLLLPYFINKN